MKEKLTTYKKLLNEFVSFKSISTDIAFKDEMTKTHDWLEKLFVKNGFKVEILPGKEMNPVVLAHYVTDPKAETILIYGHYDVQPAEGEEEWSTKDPWTLGEKKGRLIARGAIDNKGQVLVHMVTAFDLIQKGELKYNLKFMIEGNEETGSPFMPQFVKKYAKRLQSDYVMISDGETAANNPTLEVSLRGGFNMKVTLRTGKTALHSGLYGGAAPSAAHEAAKLIAKLFTKDNQIAVPGFYAGVDAIMSEQKKANKKIASKKEICEIGGFKDLVMEKGMDFFSQTGLRPTLQISGIKTGYTGEGFANIVPATAEFRINGRMVASQDSKKVAEKLKKFLEKSVPKYVDIQVEVSDPYQPIKIDVSSDKAQEVKELLEKAYGKKPILKYVGGGIPIVGDFKEILGKDTLLVSLANEDCNMHGIDENFDISMLKKALVFSEMFFSRK